MSAELPIHVQSPESRLSSYAGQPGTFFQDNEGRALEATPSTTLSAKSSKFSNGHLSAVARVAYKQLFFRLDSQVRHSNVCREILVLGMRALPVSVQIDNLLGISL